jgi:hypothetical protein
VAGAGWQVVMGASVHSVTKVDTGSAMAPVFSTTPLLTDRKVRSSDLF